MGNLDNLHTDPELLDKLKQGSAKGRTLQELREQRVSFIFGAISSESNITKEQIRQAVKEAESES